MTKQDLIAKAAADTGISEAQMSKALTALIDTIQTTVAAGQKVTITGFATFEKAFRQGGERRNPQGGMVTVPDRYVPVIKAGQTFKTTVTAA